MKIKVFRAIAGVLFVSAIMATNLKAQDRNDVIAFYNEGAKTMKTDFPVAIEAFENAIKVADQVGESANDLKQNAIKVLPGLYFKVAYAALNEKKPASEIIQLTKKSLEVAEKYGSASNKTNSEKVLIQGYSMLSAEFINQNDFDNALLACDSILMFSPGYTTALYNKALIYIRQKNSDAFEETIDSYIEKMKSANDEEKANQASTTALEYFRAAGSQAAQADNLDEALVLLNKSAKYGDDKDLFYYFADVYNKQKKFDQGAEFAQKGLDLETGDSEAKAKYYFQLGLAQSGKGQTSEACGSFKNSLFGAFAEASKAERTNLKCE